MARAKRHVARLGARAHERQVLTRTRRVEVELPIGADAEADALQVDRVRLIVQVALAAELAAVEVQVDRERALALRDLELFGFEVASPRWSSTRSSTCRFTRAVTSSMKLASACSFGFNLRNVRGDLTLQPGGDRFIGTEAKLTRPEVLHRGLDLHHVRPDHEAAAQVTLAEVPVLEEPELFHRDVEPFDFHGPVRIFLFGLLGRRFRE